MEWPPRSPTIPPPDPRREPGPTTGRETPGRADLMSISAKAEYACLALITLAQHEARLAPLTREDIARMAEVPVNLLHAIFQQLRVAGLVEIHRGWGGGYRLALPPDRISLAEVLKAVDGPPRPLKKSDQPLAGV